MASEMSLTYLVVFVFVKVDPKVQGLLSRRRDSTCSSYVSFPTGKLPSSLPGPLTSKSNQKEIGERTQRSRDAEMQDACGILAAQSRDLWVIR